MIFLPPNTPSSDILCRQKGDLYYLKCRFLWPLLVKREVKASIVPSVNHVHNFAITTTLLSKLDKHYLIVTGSNE